ASLIIQIKQEITPKPVRYVVNTHFHDDHIQGNAAYRRRGGPIDFIASTATKELMVKEAQPRLQAVLDKAVPSQFEKLGELVGQAKTAEEKAFWQDQLRQLDAYQAEMKSFALELPTITVDRSHVVKDGVQDLHIEFLGKAHTAGDVVVYCPQKRVVAAGDMILGGIPYMPDSYPKAWPRTIEAVGRLEVDKILTAHGPLLDRKRMFNQRDFMDEINARVEEAKKKGLSREDTRQLITIASLKTLQVDGYGDFMFGVRDSLFPHWGQTFLGQPPDPQGSLSGMVGTVYRRLDEEQKEAGGKPGQR